MDTTNYIERSIRNVILRTLMKKSNWWIWKEAIMKIVLFTLTYGGISWVIYTLTYSSYPSLAELVVLLIALTGLIGLVSHLLKIKMSRRYFDAKVQWIKEIKSDGNWFNSTYFLHDEAMGSMDDRNTICDKMVNELTEERRTRMRATRLPLDSRDVEGYHESFR